MITEMSGFNEGLASTLETVTMIRIPIRMEYDRIISSDDLTVEENAKYVKFLSALLDELDVAYDSAIRISEALTEYFEG